MNLKNKGQLSIELLLITVFMVLIVISIFFPIANLSFDYSSDISKYSYLKNEILKIANAIDYCYYAGKGSKKIVYLNFDEDTSIKLFHLNNKGTLTSNFKLANGSIKIIKVYSDYDLFNEKLSFNKGFNKISVIWPENSSNLIITKLI